MAAKKGHIVYSPVSDVASLGVEKIKQGSSHVSLNCSGLNDDDAIGVAETIRNNNTLQVLALYSNQITDVGAIMVAEALRDNRNLKFLGLSHNLINDDGIIMIAEALENNKSLQTLTLFDNEGITDRSVPALKKMLKTSSITYMGGGGPDVFCGTSISEEAKRELSFLLSTPAEKRNDISFPEMETEESPCFLF